MLVCRQQAFLNATQRGVWDLVGHPERHSEWWPEVIEIRGTEFGPGCSYCQVSNEGEKVREANFSIERIEELRELLVRCSETGVYMRWLLTGAQGGTFVNAEFGIDPGAVEEREDFDPDATRAELRRWLVSSLNGLAEAAGGPGYSSVESR